jgi:signal transduction histidine kinase
MTRLVEQLLDVTRVERGHLELHAQDFDLVEALREIVVEMSAARPDFEFAFDPPAIR